MPWEGRGEDVTSVKALPPQHIHMPNAPPPILTSSDTRLSIAPSMECSAPREAGDILLGEPGDLPRLPAPVLRLKPRGTAVIQSEKQV